MIIGKGVKMKSNDVNLIELYSKAIFILEDQHKLSLPNPFAIITASNPLGKVLSAEQNKQKNILLKAELEQVLHLPVIGASDDLSHQEQSFIVQVSKPAAIGLASKYEQNAIYWVESDDLHIVPVLMSGDEVSVGNFSERVR